MLTRLYWRTESMIWRSNSGSASITSRSASPQKHTHKHLQIHPNLIPVNIPTMATRRDFLSLGAMTAASMATSASASAQPVAAGTLTAEAVRTALISGDSQRGPQQWGSSESHGKVGADGMG